MQHIVVIFAGQGCQVPPDSHWEQDPQAGPLLQDQESTGPQLEVVCICDAFEMLFLLFGLENLIFASLLPVC